MHYKFVGIEGNIGAGKTTLLKILAGNLKLKTGNLKIGHNVIIGYQSQEFGETLNPDLSVFETLLKDNDMNDNDARKILGDFGFSKDSAQFLHTEHFILVDHNKKIRGIYNGTLELEAQQLIKDIVVLKNSL